MKKYIYLGLTIANFLIFAWDIENDRDMITWLWLSNSIIWGYLFAKNDK